MIKKACHFWQAWSYDLPHSVKPFSLLVKIIFSVHMSSWGRPMFLGCLARPGLLFKNDQLLSLGFPSRENWQKNQLISIILQWLTELSWKDGTWGHVWSPVWSENEHSRSAQDGWGQEKKHGWGYGDIVFRKTSKLYSTEINNKSVQKK